MTDERRLIDLVQAMRALATRWTNQAVTADAFDATLAKCANELRREVDRLVQR